MKLLIMTHLNCNYTQVAVIEFLEMVINKENGRKIRNNSYKIN